MTSATRDLASHELWDRSLERSRRRRELAEDARKTISRRRQASLAVSAAMATTPVIPSVIAGAMTKTGTDSHPTRTLQPDSGQRILLKRGAVSPSVALVQRKLEIIDDGYYGPVTERAVRKFQKQHHLLVTGMVDVKTWLKLFPDGMVIYKPNSGVAQMSAQAPQGVLRTASAQTGAGLSTASLVTPDSAGKAAVKGAKAGKKGKAGKGLDVLGSGKGAKHKASSSGSNGSGSPASRSSGSSSGSSARSGSVGVKPGGSTVVPSGPFKSASEMIAAMIAKANQIDSQHYAYSWGGGHNPSFSGPYDCSGAVSAVLHAAGLLKAPMVSGDFAHWGRPGRGAVTIYANAGHVYMSILGHYFGTTSMNPGGGAGWFDGAPRPGFVVVHVPFESMNLSKAQLRRIVAAAEARERKRRRKHGLSTASASYQSVTPGYSGQAPGGTYSSGGSSYTPPPDPAPAPAPAPDTSSSEQTQVASSQTTYDSSGTASNGSSSDSYSSGGAAATDSGVSSAGYNAGSTSDGSSGETSAASVDSGSSGSSSDGSSSYTQSSDSASDGSSGAGSTSSGSSYSGSSGSDSSGSDSSSGSGSGSSGSSGSSDSGSSSSGSSDSGSSDSGSSGSGTNAASTVESAGSSAGDSAGSAVGSTQSAAGAATSAAPAPSGAGSSGSSGSSGAAGSDGQ